MREIKVWDVPTRIFHWLLVASVALAYFTSSGRPHGFQFALHVGAGYVVVMLLAYRLAWGFVGGEHALFASFVRGWRAIGRHAAKLVRFQGQRTPGHNPIGGWMILLMLANLILLVATGLLAQGKAGGAGPLTSFVSVSFARSIGGVHRLLGNLILILAGIHFAGVVAESLLLRENLSLAMVTGTKPAVRGEVDARPAPLRRAVVLLILVLLLGVLMAAMTTIPVATPPGAVG